MTLYKSVYIYDFIIPNYKYMGRNISYAYKGNVK